MSDEVLPIPEPIEKITQELINDIHPDWDTRTWKFRCSSCKKVMEGSIERLRELIKFYRPDEYVEIRSQFHIPFIDATVTLWKRSKPRQPKVFIR